MIDCTFEDGNKASLRHTVVDAIVVREGKILLVRRAAKLLEGGKWGVPGDFMDRDETAKQAAAREIYEETGWTVKDLTLLRINDSPNRPRENRQNVDFVFFCTADSKTGEPDWETDEVQWFDLDNLPPAGQMAFDHLENIKLYRRYLQEKFALPVSGELKILQTL